MMDEIMRQEERILLNQIAKLTEEGHLAWDCVEYNPIGFLDKDEYSEQSACICQMFQFEATIGGLPHELELAEYINVPSGKMDLAVTLTRNDEEHFMKIDSILSVELDPYINATPQSIDSMAAVRLAKSLVPLAAKTDVVAEAYARLPDGNIPLHHQKCPQTQSGRGKSDGGLQRMPYSRLLMVAIGIGAMLTVQ